MSLGIPEVIVIVLVVLLLFGAKRIPELARSLGRAQHEYKKAKDALKEEAEDNLFLRNTQGVFYLT